MNTKVGGNVNLVFMALTFLTGGEYVVVTKSSLTPSRLRRALNLLESHFYDILTLNKSLTEHLFYLRDQNENVTFLLLVT